jgi:hypothetical protein
MSPAGPKRPIGGGLIFTGPDVGDSGTPLRRHVKTSVQRYKRLAPSLLFGEALLYLGGHGKS